MMAMNNSQRAVTARSECKETGFTVDLTSLAGESLNQSHHLISPYGGVALIPNCFSIKLKVLQHASATVNKSAA